MNDRREFLKTAGAAALTTSLFTGRVRGANDRIRVAFIGMGRMGTESMQVALRLPNVEVPAVCDVYQPNLEKAVAITGRGPDGTPDVRTKAKGITDFREVLHDKSIDAVNISTPDHWHPYMTVEACKNGKDVYVEKPISVVIDEGRKMVQAARKYDRVVQVGTWQRSGVHFQKAVEIVTSGKLGKVTFVRTWNYGHQPQEGIGNPPDSDPPAGLDWNMWLGPAPARQFNKNRFGVDPKQYSFFRYFWDYAGGMMTDWGIHLLDIVQMAFNETEPASIVGLGGKFYLQDDRETPDTLEITYQYPNGMLATYENREANAQSMFKHGYGILFHGTEGTLFVDRAGYQLVAEKNSALEAAEVERSNDALEDHWKNFIECIQTRKRPASDIEIGHHSTTTAILGNMAYRSKLRLDWDAQRETTAQPEARHMLKREYRKPWKLEV
ncbi:MAG TPA: Gfo/Idh/MocA family oxidoreductase [Bryobacteraceae bacterium]|nr:Gfo/Idh/MocA family oxidoreductase [Bryobacteraceae bacterium]